MRSREEVEAWVKSKQSPATELESLRLQVTTIELLLDIRDQLEGIGNAIPIEPIEINVKNDYS